MIITITSVTQEFAKNGSEYRKVTGATGDGRETTKSIFNQLEEKWPLLVENATLEFVMEKRGQYWNVKDIKTVGDNLPVPAETKVVESAMPTEQEMQQVKDSLPPPAPQAVGMCTKEIGDMIRASQAHYDTALGILHTLFSAEIAERIIDWYKGQILDITRIAVTGRKEMPIELQDDLSLTWDSVRAKLSSLYGKAEGWQLVEEVNKKMLNLGATQESDLKKTYYTLTDENKRKFIELMDSAKK